MTLDNDAVKLQDVRVDFIGSNWLGEVIAGTVGRVSLSAFTRRSTMETLLSVLQNSVLSLDGNGFY